MRTMLVCNSTATLILSGIAAAGFHSLLLLLPLLLLLLLPLLMLLHPTQLGDGG